MSNSNVIDVFVKVDTVALRAQFPNGLPIHAGREVIDDYFSVLVDSEHHIGNNGIRCAVGDIINFRSLPRTNTNNSVIINEFSDRNGSLVNDPTQLTDYIAPPAFKTSIRRGTSYHNRAFPSPSQWNGWELWMAPLAIGEHDVEDSFMSLSAVKSTLELESGCITYTLGFNVTYADGVNLNFYFDPTIEIT